MNRHNLLSQATKTPTLILDKILDTKFNLVSVSILLKVFLLFFCIFLPRAVFAEDEILNNGCNGHDELIELNSTELLSATPCDLIGASFLMGLGSEYASLNIVDILRNRTTEKINQSLEYSYYHLVRAALRTRALNEEVMSPDSFGKLLLGIVALPEVSGVNENSVKRATYYRSFVLSQYWHKESTISAEVQSNYADAITALLTNGVVQNIGELNCLITADIPTLEIKDVLNSVVFSECIEGVYD